SSPPTLSPCYYGIDTPRREDLIAARQTVEDINEYITSDTLGYLSVEGLYQAVADAGGSFCDACFTGRYPVDIISEQSAPQLALFK
ncbi:MAG: amidophosphoribosyltransferase, partial [Deltaproteobacteria bacterium]|nr:amidophosphoribosyltransferase [Deltaproteobacteria bacterium]